MGKSGTNAGALENDRGVAQTSGQMRKRKVQKEFADPSGPTPCRRSELSTVSGGKNFHYETRDSQNRGSLNDAKAPENKDTTIKGSSTNKGALKVRRSKD